uniref:Phytocyanin domain-containing protein n=1 Tax=Kalanchoe fedtschenkoi TaxID=63787 RepID=A0A7N0VN80_KALFE
MGMGKRVCGGVLLSTAFLQLSVCYGAVYLVGDKTGWTTIGNYDYQGWAATKNFQVGDVITFVYHQQFHNVMQVTHPEYRSCNVTKPIAAYATGNDSITINNYGHHYFLCGVPGHCQSGQKVDINVHVASDVAPSPSGLVNVSNPSTPVPTLSPSNAPRLSSGHFVTLLGALAMPLLATVLL